MDKPIVGISCGDLNGIGFEVIIKTFMNTTMLDFCTPVVFASSKVASYHRKALDIKDFSFHIINDLKEINPKKVNLINIWNDTIAIDLGEAKEDTGSRAIESVDACMAALKNEQIDLMVTAPLNKNTVKIEGKQFRGHTEYLGENLGGEPLMILISKELKVALATGHIAIKDVAQELTKERLQLKIKQFESSLRQDFGISKPKIAVLGLNPHAGDGGVMGKEEEEIIAPAIQELGYGGSIVMGPYPSDGFFGAQTYQKFDGVLAMYHDQGLIPFKTLSFEDGVNYTAGMPFVRTSPDHGTGYDIAGKNKASEVSFREAILSGVDIHRTRKEYLEIHGNALKKQKLPEKR